jgi:hypothetical protein
MVLVDGEHPLVEDVLLFFVRELARQRRVVAHPAVSLGSGVMRRRRVYASPFTMTNG